MQLNTYVMHNVGLVPRRPSPTPFSPVVREPRR
jgi:hypothetical protein